MEAENPMTLLNRWDTTSLNVMDGEGNLFSMTESDGHLTTPLIPGWGFGLGNRGGQFNLDPDLANVVAPGKRPRNTNTPFVIMKDGKPYMGLSLAGGDLQAQALLQIFLNVAEWGMTPQQAMDHPRFGSYNFPGTGRELNSNPARLNLGRTDSPRDLRSVGEARAQSWELGFLELHGGGRHHHLSRPGDRIHHGGGRPEAGDVCARILKEYRRQIEQKESGRLRRRHQDFSSDQQDKEKSERF